MPNYLIARVVMLVVLLLGLGARVCASVESGADFAPTIEVESYGEYRLLGKSERTFKAETTAGYASVIQAEHVRTTETIKLARDRVFGFTYAIADATATSGWITVAIEVQHPSTVDYLGKRSTGFRKLSAAHLKADGRYHNSAFYVFSEPYEMVPGEWIISVSYGTEVTATKRFIVR